MVKFNAINWNKANELLLLFVSNCCVTSFCMAFKLTFNDHNCDIICGWAAINSSFNVQMVDENKNDDYTSRQKIFELLWY